jgi:hypothetical protein
LRQVCRADRDFCFRPRKFGSIEGKNVSGRNASLGWILVAVSAVAFSVLTAFAWRGELGLKALVLLVIAGAALLVGRRNLSAEARKPVDTTAKAIFTVVGIMALLRHRIPIEDHGYLPIYVAIAKYIDSVDPWKFVLFGLIAMAIKFVGVIASAFGWHLLLVGQGVRYPFWSGIMTAFLIGRFIGTFLPSTIGLDGYTLFEAGRYSNQWSRCVTAKALEKFVGIAGLFLGMVVTLPFGYQVIVDVVTNVGRPEAAPLLAAGIAGIAGGICLVVIVALVWPVLLTRTMSLVGRFLPGSIRAQVDKLASTVGAYRGQVGLLFAVLFSKFITHFTTAVVYYFTALAIGVTAAQFWPITFGSTIQILATVLSPTIAGEGAREAFQALLLSKQLGGVAQAVLSGALGFIAAEAATMWGGAFLWTRKPGWRPAFTTVDGAQVDYAWIDDSEDAGFDAEKIAAAAR